LFIKYPSRENKGDFFWIKIQLFLRHYQFKN
jgi:hypothetical protein